MFCCAIHVNSLWMLCSELWLFVNEANWIKRSLNLDLEGIKCAASVCVLVRNVIYIFQLAFWTDAIAGLY